MSTGIARIIGSGEPVAAERGLPAFLHRGPEPVADAESTPTNSVSSNPSDTAESDAAVDLEASAERLNEGNEALRAGQLDAAIEAALDG